MATLPYVVESSITIGYHYDFKSHSDLSPLTIAFSMARQISFNFFLSRNNVNINISIARTTNTKQANQKWYKWVYMVILTTLRKWRNHRPYATSVKTKDIVIIIKSYEKARTNIKTKGLKTRNAVPRSFKLFIRITIHQTWITTKAVLNIWIYAAETTTSTATTIIIIITTIIVSMAIPPATITTTSLSLTTSPFKCIKL